MDGNANESILFLRSGENSSKSHNLIGWHPRHSHEMHNFKAE